MKRRPDPKSIQLARQIAPRLEGLCWGIGGSSLLWRYDNLHTPDDLDIVTTPADFSVFCARVVPHVQKTPRISSNVYASDQFATFIAKDGTQMDVMAGIAVMKLGMRIRWEFDPQNIEIDDDLPWMMLADWKALYTLFDRPARVVQIDALRRRHGLF